jgi:DNA-binding HxlR family transcriptional regulator
MLGNSRERDQLKATDKQNRALQVRVGANEERLQDSLLLVRRWSEARRRSKCSPECFVRVAVNLIHGKWKTRILSRLRHGPVRLGELRRILPQASKKMLAQHLREMERDGLVVRKNLSGRVLHVEYSLSESGGYATVHLISMLQDWSNEHLPFRTKE